MLLCYFTLKMLFTQYSIIFTQSMIYVHKCNPYTDQYVELFQHWMSYRRLKALKVPPLGSTCVCLPMEHASELK